MTLDVANSEKSSRKRFLKVVAPKDVSFISSLNLGSGQVTEIPKKVQESPNMPQSSKSKENETIKKLGDISEDEKSPIEALNCKIDAGKEALAVE